MSDYPDWFSGIAREFFDRHLPKEMEIRALQIGSYTGDATEWLINNRNLISIDDVDTWEGSNEDQHYSLDFFSVEDFYTKRFLNEPRVTKYKMTSGRFFIDNSKTYNFIYVDGDHTASQVAVDGLNAFKCLESGGILAFDDYLWKSYREEFLEPKLGANAALKIWSGKYEVLEVGYQVWIRKH